MVVFSGVILYKVVFQLEKAENMENASIRSDGEKDELAGKLVENEIGFRDEVEDSEGISLSRAVELVGRHGATHLGRSNSKRLRDDAPILEGTKEKDFELPKLV